MQFIKFNYHHFVKRYYTIGIELLEANIAECHQTHTSLARQQEF